MNFKKTAVRFLSVALILSSLASCSDDTHIISYDDGNAEETIEKSPKIAKEDITAVLLLPADPDKGACMSAAHKNAFTTAAEELGLKATVIPTVSDDSINEATAAANVIFGAGYNYMDLLDKGSRNNPDKLYSCFGGYKYNSSNYTNYYTAIYEAQYLAGIAAGTKSKSGKIGIISEFSSEYPDSAAEINSFTLGAKSANPDIQIIVRSLKSRSNTDDAEEFTHALIAEGCDVISIQCDTSDPANVAIKKNVHYIGYGTDMRDLHKDLCLTSVVWDLSTYYREALNSAMNGTWAANNYYGDLNQKAVLLSDLSYDADPITKTRIDSTAKLINGNKFEVFSNKKIRYNAEGKAETYNAELIDNNSNVMISEDGSQCFLYSGEELVSIDPSAATSDTLASANMNYLVEGVTVHD